MKNFWNKVHLVTIWQCYSKLWHDKLCFAVPNIDCVSALSNTNGIALLFVEKKCWLILDNISAGIRKGAKPIRVLLPISWSEQVGREPLFRLCHESRGTLADIESRQIKHSKGTPWFWSLICEADRGHFCLSIKFWTCREDDKGVC